MLRQRDPEVVRPLVEWIIAHVHRLGAPFLEELAAQGLVPFAEVEAYQNSDNPDEAAAAVVVLWQSWRPVRRRAALDILLRLLESADVGTRVAGVRALGRLGTEGMGRFAVSHLADPALPVREAASRALARVASPESTELLEPVMETIRSGTARQAFIGLETLGSIGDPAAIPELLRLSESFTPPLRRNVVRVLHRMGLKGIPRTVGAVRDPSYPYVGRLIAARSLSRLSFAQLEAIAPTIVQEEFERAARFEVGERVLSGADDPGGAVLSRFYGDMRLRIAEFILELYSIAGRLPDFELLRMSLRSGNARERANALETIEQGVSRTEFARLRPLLADRPREPGGSAEDPVPERVLANALSSSFELESAAAAVALWHRDRARALMTLRDVVAVGFDGLLRATTAGLLSNRGGRGVVEGVCAMMTAAFFSRLPIWEIEDLVRGAVVRESPEGEVVTGRGEAADRVHVVLEGTVRMAETAGQVCRAGALVGEEALTFRSRYLHEARSEGAVLLELQRSAILAAAEGSGEVAMQLLLFGEGGRA
jgi:HEAT repeat protein